MNKWQQFTTLGWYDGLIEFLFRFVAKTSEPLLAAGLVISAADYLSHGAVMAGHPAFSMTWAWAQAAALESSSGVVFVYALQAFRQADKVKGAIYLALAVVLAIVGGGMLLLQVNAVTMGSSETAVPVLNILRVVVSIAYIFLLRAKSIRFSDLADVAETQGEHPVQPAPLPAPIDLAALLEQLDERYSQRMQAIVEQVVTRVQVNVTQESAPTVPPALPEPAESRASTEPPFSMIEQAMYDALVSHPEDAEALARLAQENNLEDFIALLKTRYSQYAEYITPARVIRVKQRLAREQAHQSSVPALEAQKSSANLQPIYDARFASKEQEIAALLARKPDATAEEIAHEAGCSTRTAAKWMKRLMSPSQG
jgi:hypothetical protein